MARVIIDEKSVGLRKSEQTVAIKDAAGDRYFLPVDSAFLSNIDGRDYLPVGIVYIDQAKGLTLIELPVEADSGANRLWVPSSSIAEELEAAR